MNNGPNEQQIVNKVVDTNGLFEPKVNGVRYPASYFANNVPHPKDKPKLPWLKYIGICAAAILLIVIALAIIDKSFRSFILGEQFSYYKIGGKSQQYSILFYNNASTSSSNLGSTEESIMTSPTIKQFGEPVILTLDATFKSTSSAPDNTCDLVIGSAAAFSVYIPALRTYAQFCSSRGVYYYSYFRANNTQYLLQIQIKLPPQFSSLQAAEQSTYGASFLSNGLNPTDLQVIVQSLKPQP